MSTIPFDCPDCGAHLMVPVAEPQQGPPAQPPGQGPPPWAGPPGGSPGNPKPPQTQTKLKRTLLVTVPVDATVQHVASYGGPGTPTDLTTARIGQQIDIWTAAAPTTLKAQRGDDGVLNASLISLVGS